MQEIQIAGNWNNLGNTNNIRNTRQLTKGQFTLMILEYGCHKILLSIPFQLELTALCTCSVRKSNSCKQPRGLGLGGRFVSTIMLNFIQHIITFFLTTTTKSTVHDDVTEKESVYHKLWFPKTNTDMLGKSSIL